MTSAPKEHGAIQKFITGSLPRQFDYPEGNIPYSNEDKLEQGPCKQEYAKLALCAKIKGEAKHIHHQGLCRNEMKQCPDEAKSVVTCIAENEGYFFNM